MAERRKNPRRVSDGGDMENTMKDGWTPFQDGFVKGDVAVFGGIFGWRVCSRTNGEWAPVEPRISAAREGMRFHDGGRREPYEFWKRTREETIAEAMTLADEWAEKQKAAATPKDDRG